MDDREVWKTIAHNISAQSWPGPFSWSEPSDASFPATPCEDHAERDHFNSGIETAASHLERAGLKLMAREIRDYRKS
jgi:hypothetical protein